MLQHSRAGQLLPALQGAGNSTCAQHLAMRRRSGSGVDASMAGRAALMATCTMICSAQRPCKAHHPPAFPVP